MNKIIDSKLNRFKNKVFMKKLKIIIKNHQFTPNNQLINLY